MTDTSSESATNVGPAVRPVMVDRNGKELNSRSANALAIALEKWSCGRGATNRELCMLIRELTRDSAFVRFVQYLPPFLDEQNMATRLAALKVVAIGSHQWTVDASTH